MSGPIPFWALSDGGSRTTSSTSRGVTVVLVTHAEEVARRAGRRLRMRDGRILDQE